MMSFESVVDQIYEAAADPGLWPQVMRHLGRSADAAGGIILTRRADAWLGRGYSPALEGVNEYLSSPAVADSQTTVRLLAENRAGFVGAHEVFTEEEWVADHLMTEWAIGAGLPHAAATAIPAPTGDLVVVQINRRKDQPQFDRDDISRLDAFRPHLARAGLLAARWRLERLRAAAQALA